MSEVWGGVNDLQILSGLLIIINIHFTCDISQEQLARGIFNALIQKPSLSGIIFHYYIFPKNIPKNYFHQF